MEMKLKPMMHKTKKGQLGLVTVKYVFVALFVLAVIAIAIILALVSLNNSGIFDAGSQEANDSDLIVNNVTTGLTEFFAETGTIMSILIVVVIILAIAIIIAVVTRFGGRGGAASL